MEIPRIPLRIPVKIKTTNNENIITKEIITEVPVEFNENKATMAWKLMKIQNKKFVGIIGQNLLKPLGAKIDLERGYIEINKIKTHFENYKNQIEEEKCPYEYNEIHTLEYCNSTNMSQLFSENLNGEERKELCKFIDENKQIFYNEGDRLTSTTQTVHNIRTKHDNPIFSKIYRYPEIHEKEIERQIKDLLNQGIIRKSISPYSSPIWVVSKKRDNSGEQKWRMVIDYRKMNEVTIDFKHPITNIDQILDKLGRAQYFSTLDLAKGFHQIKMNPADIEKTAFSTSFGHYEWLRMPFGLKNAPATFQRMMNEVLEGLINKICVVYLDDILVFSTSLQEHMINLRLVFQRLRRYNLKVQVDKCNFLKKETQFLGHTITANGVKPNNDKIEAIDSIPLPTTQTQIKSFLGITGYYRKFIKDYAKIAQPMTFYLKKNKKIDIKDITYVKAHQELKNALQSKPVLIYPDFNEKFTLTTDASDYAIGAVLSQKGHPITFISRTLNVHERNYSTTEKELLAIVWAVKYLRPYLYGRKFDLKTDHQPLKWLQMKNLGKDISPRLQRWILQLGEYDMRIEYLKGTSNTVADFLSREIKTEEINVVENESEQVNISDLDTIHSQLEEANDHFPIKDTPVNVFKQQIILKSGKEIKKVKNRISIGIELLDKDSFNDLLIPYIEPNVTGIYTDLAEADYNKLQQKLISLFGTRIKFYKCEHFAKDLETEEEAIKQIKLYHEYETGHSGIEENYKGLRTKIYFKKLRELVNDVINSCNICKQSKYDRKPIKPKFYLTETPRDINEIIHVDIYHIAKTKYLTTIDKFSKLATSTYIPNVSHETLEETFAQIISSSGKPKKYIMDNEFNFPRITALLEKLNIEFHFTKVNSHTGNSDIEVFHRTLAEKIRCILNGKTKPDIHEIRLAVHKANLYYNNAIHSTTKKSPYAVHSGEVDKNKLFQYIQKHKKNLINKANKDRENYLEIRAEGFIKNSRTDRQKTEPRYKFDTLEDQHLKNIQKERVNNCKNNDNLIRMNQRNKRTQNKNRNLALNQI